MPDMLLPLLRREHLKRNESKRYQKGDRKLVLKSTRSPTTKLQWHEFGKVCLIQVLLRAKYASEDSNAVSCSY